MWATRRRYPLRPPRLSFAGMSKIHHRATPEHSESLRLARLKESLCREKRKSCCPVLGVAMLYI